MTINHLVKLHDTKSKFIIEKVLLSIHVFYLINDRSSLFQYSVVFYNNPSIQNPLMININCVRAIEYSAHLSSSS